MLKEILQKIGLTRGESDVYITLLKVGNTTSGTLIKESGVSRSKVYEVLERLKQKGLVTEMTKQKVRYFEAAKPSRIIDLVKSEKKEIEDREKEAENIIPKLIQLQKHHLEKQEAKVYTGLEGWKAVFNEILDILDEGDEYIAFGIGPDELMDKRVELFFRKFHMRRAEKRIKVRLIMHERTRKIMERSFSDLKYYNYRFLDTDFPTNINIHKDNVLILVWGENPVAFLISSKQVADKYRKYFEEMWKKAVP